jgi:phosphoglycerate dehydrogenase-like enzyme
MTIAVFNAMLRPLIEERLPDWLEPRWFASTEELYALAPEAEIGWFDTFDLPARAESARRAVKLKWMNTLSAGVEELPLDIFRANGVTLTNGAGINAVTIAEYAVMGMLTLAKGYREVVRAADRREWLGDAPGKVELLGSRALIIGAGAIGSLIADRLRPFGVDMVSVRRRPQVGDLGPDDWRSQLGAFDWVIVTAPATPETEHMIGAAELAAMKPSASLLNFARASLVDQQALIEALQAKRIAAAFLDVTDPEPLPPEHPLWSLDNAHITMHLSGRSQTLMYARSAQRFLENLKRWSKGEPLSYVVDLDRGY